LANSLDLQRRDNQRQNRTEKLEKAKDGFTNQADHKGFVEQLGFASDQFHELGNLSGESLHQFAILGGGLLNDGGWQRRWRALLIPVVGQPVAHQLFVE
jgi:hypothetical protein